jgi:hypothetical protein
MEHKFSAHVQAKVEEKFLSHESDDGFVFYRPNKVKALRIAYSG